MESIMARISRIAASTAAAACLLLAPAATFAQQTAKPESGMHMTKAPAATGPVSQVNGRLVCMLTNKAFDKPQLPVKVKGRTYYGCCSMCKHMLQTDAANRVAIDPISGKKVDKSKAVIGKDSKDSVVYFQNESDLQKYNAKVAQQSQRKEAPGTPGSGS
jgi:YHS domain-containing protein